MPDALMMAEDVLALVLYGYEADGKVIPEPSLISDLDLSAGEFANYIPCDTMEYRKRFNNKAVKKTLTIPEWLNEAAQENNVNFSLVLQEALKEKLKIQ